MPGSNSGYHAEISSHVFWSCALLTVSLSVSLWYWGSCWSWGLARPLLMLFILHVSDVFLMVRLTLWVWGRKTQRRSILIHLSCYWEDMISTWLFTDEVNLDHLAMVGFASFSTIRLKFFLFFIFFMQITESSSCPVCGLSSTSQRGIST